MPADGFIGLLCAFDLTRRLRRSRLALVRPTQPGLLPAMTRACRLPGRPVPVQYQHSDGPTDLS